MLDINMSDVMNVLGLIRPYLIAFGVILAAAVILILAVRKVKEPRRYLIRSQARVAVVISLMVVVSLICTGPLSTLLSLVSGSGAITADTQAAAEALGMEIADEGIVLLKNEENLLPMTDNKNLNVFGWASTNPVYGGTGSGALSDAYEIVNLTAGLENAGFSLNTELSDFYTQYRADRPVVGMWEQEWTLPEPSVDSYTEDMLNSAREFSDTAMVVFSRPGGEHIDLPENMEGLNYTNNSDEYEDFTEGMHYLELSQSERNMLELVCDNFENVIVIYNGANTMELGFVNEYPQIKSVLWVPGTGQNGFNSLGSILAGGVNPSGKTADTFAADLTASPSFNNFGDFTYDNMEEFRIADSDQFVPGALPHFVNYVEGIYVGYRFYETAAEEGLIDYDEAVTYPFGYGLSYTTFAQEMGELTEEDGILSVDVTVTNTGDTAGKDVVELYYNPPYTNGGIEKASVNLAAFDKTDELAPGESQTLTLSFSAEDMASYDYRDAQAYVLEEGDYEISLRTDSHTVVDTQTYTVDETVVYGEENKRSTDEAAAVNAFDFAEGEVEYLSRADGFANYEEAVAAPVTFSMPEADKALFTNNSNWEPQEDAEAVMPVTGANNRLTLADMRGLDYNDEQWEALLDQLTVDEMNQLAALGGYQTAAAESVGKVQTTDCDGPASINNNFTGVGSIGFPCGVMIANTFNEDIAREFGQSIGTMADEMNVSGWYAPAVNIHRSAFAGRNFEYYSEDGLLAGKIASQAIQGAAEHGVYAYVKHFAMNEQETNRWEMLTTWSNEQAIREIYLKPFELAIKEGGAMAVMSSYNYIGSQWAGACSSLLETVLRDEWGFEGFILTDYFASFGYMDAARSIYNGGSTCLASYDTGTNYITYTDSATMMQRMREACHRIFYTVVNSRAYEPENINTGLLLYQIILIAADVIVAVLLILYEVFRVRKVYRKRKDAAHVVSAEELKAE
ncbi:glycosyl hydrolase family 3 N-terminal domain protein [Marvinbryantia formatexigens DSM 14469]|uniref:Glycosyl hydrolase family 3 N-terminal domain protein n=1 Tax=Marvinbryantia formatexigens DSM 14469 TaxID=478749 RepID=C6LDN4_9FIRM|nr:glycoside hydrolase family 3 N-terminal domain-containing protein [Marvinbryantia formatexigens]EET61088.1 glycosyl hydrolase family 3 N-terminal domain protein [Marvinbryantia formatexigens DSM 14469]UWO23675.1 glycoside hydrolase family 3 C-terminal domain-containing protein [Marvinbryantia formatexigens DSM 14469]SDF65705.1 beta-glucosidase [Marvinbryantia formatexigens]